MKLFLAVLLAAAGCGSLPVRAPASPAPALPRYTMDIALVPATHELRVTGTLVVPAPGTTVTLALMDAMTDVELTSTPAGAWSAASPPRPGAGKLDRTLTLPAGAREVAIRFSYVSHVETRFVYHVGEDAMFAGGADTAWYPQLPDTRSIGTLRFHAPERYRFVAGGSATDRSAAGERVTTVAYTRPSMFSFVAAEFIERSQGGVVPMRAYLLRDRPGIAAYLDGCTRALAVLSREFGAYAYDGFALVELPTETAEAAGFDGAGFEGFMASTSDTLDAPFNLAFFGHELGHQWWGNLVTKQGDEGGMLLDEGLAQYGSLRVVEELAGPAAAEAYRRRGYPGYNMDQSGLGYLRSAAAGLDEPVAAANAGYTRLTHMLSNSKGLLAFDHLSRLIGRDRFSAALREITARHAFGSIAWRDVRAVVEAHAGRDLGPVFARWFDRTGAPDWTVEWTPGGRTARGVIVQRGAPYQLELDVALIGARDSITRRIAIAGERTPFAFDAPFDVERVELDPHFTVLHWTPEYRVEAEAFIDYTRACTKLFAGETEAAAAQFRAALDQTPADEPHGVRFKLQLMYALLLYMRGELGPAREQLTAALAGPVRPADSVAWAYARLAQIAAREHDRDAVARYARAAADAETASGHALGAAAMAAALRDHPAR
ncbi:MAG TPA: M1 family aminopeptidase [Kofleriaceae bacterium]|nr:M1 family aminopeptidase [Kofleriaceae bacterium]